ncbi:DUF11 domain-containing protein [Streptantibioticus rubrisoli]|uniref:DUF11 domain-containing protein n=1 Tax=Streptantibioticus rubrisoli TaxID=1387313 RepID=A0ABT1PBL7_9ACTN|nr:DUF11 domain-containing protein [Streptantibioticus rubrisoli]MCQ4042769.1 DUF11 domain-containing protein [Streptantibioticus rubrisoli]
MKRKLCPTLGRVAALAAATAAGMLPVTAFAAPAQPAPAPLLTVQKSHTQPFQQGGNGQYSITVTNIGNAATTGDPVTVTDTLPSGLTLNGSASGTGWTCTNTSSTLLVCTSTTSVAPMTAFPDITVPVTIDPHAPRAVLNNVTATGGGDPVEHSYTDLTLIQPTASGCRPWSWRWDECG